MIFNLFCLIVAGILDPVPYRWKGFARWIFFAWSSWIITFPERKSWQYIIICDYPIYLPLHKENHCMAYHTLQYVMLISYRSSSQLWVIGKTFTVVLDSASDFLAWKSLEWLPKCILVLYQAFLDIASPRIYSCNSILRTTSAWYYNRKNISQVIYFIWN